MDDPSASRRAARSDADDAAQMQWMRDVADRGVAASSAWGKLFKAYRRKIVGFGLRRNLPLAESEDLLQEVMIAVYAKASQFRFGNTPSPWIMQIARNALFDKLNALKKQRDDHREPVEDDSVEDERLPISPPPDSTVPQQVTDDCLRRGWQSFVHDHGDAALIMAMRDAEGWSIPELAEHIGRSEGATRQFLSELRKKVKPYLEPCL